MKTLVVVAVLTLAVGTLSAADKPDSFSLTVTIFATRSVSLPEYGITTLIQTASLGDGYEYDLQCASGALRRFLNGAARGGASASGTVTPTVEGCSIPAGEYRGKRTNGGLKLLMNVNSKQKQVSFHIVGQRHQSPVAQSILPQNSRLATPPTVESTPPAWERSARPNNAGVYAGTGSGHWISKVSSNGMIVVLEDGSTWEIASLDRIDTALWLPTTDITVLQNDGGGQFTYLLINTEDGEKANARYLGK